MGISEPKPKALVLAKRNPIVDTNEQPSRIVKPKKPQTMVLRPIPKK
jgi:hypothetical protein